MASRADLIEAIQNIPWFVDLTPTQVERLVGIANIRQVAEGELLFREGDREDLMYIILEGQVKLDSYVPSYGPLFVYTADPLDILGWSSMTPVVRQRTASGRALACVKLLTFDSEALRRLCEEDHDLGYLIMKRLSNLVASQYLVNRLALYDLIMRMTQEQALPPSLGINK
ncbi:MAG TPA: cyclic nucleotide-binding domain-containing protein [Anaerolineaceae bacterium]|nr:cyclic nucleotide-binding domain-containing protein [Anaerolineaceae bacterium]